MTEKEQYDLNQKLIAASTDGDLSEVKRLINIDADINANNGYLEVVKYLVGKEAASNGRVEIIKYLLESCEDIYLKSTVLAVAAYYGHLEVVKYLILEHNCKITVALKNAKKYGRDEVMQWCESYIRSKELNDSLDLNLTKESQEINKKKIKV